MMEDNVKVWNSKYSTTVADVKAASSTERKQFNAEIKRLVVGIAGYLDSMLLKFLKPDEISKLPQTGKGQLRIWRKSGQHLYVASGSNDQMTIVAEEKETVESTATATPNPNTSSLKVRRGNIRIRRESIEMESSRSSLELHIAAAADSVSCAITLGFKPRQTIDVIKERVAKYIPGGKNGNQRISARVEKARKFLYESQRAQKSNAKIAVGVNDYGERMLKLEPGDEYGDIIRAYQSLIERNSAISAESLIERLVGSRSNWIKHDYVLLTGEEPNLDNLRSLLIENRTNISAIKRIEKLAATMTKALKAFYIEKLRREMSDAWLKRIGEQNIVGEDINLIELQTTQNQERLQVVENRLRKMLFTGLT